MDRTRTRESRPPFPKRTSPVVAAPHRRLEKAASSSVPVPTRTSNGPDVDLVNSPSQSSRTSSSPARHAHPSRCPRQAIHPHRAATHTPPRYTSTKPSPALFNSTSDTYDGLPAQPGSQLLLLGLLQARPRESPISDIDEGEGESKVAIDAGIQNVLDAMNGIMLPGRCAAAGGGVAVGAQEGGAGSSLARLLWSTVAGRGRSNLPLRRLVRRTLEMEATR